MTQSLGSAEGSLARCLPLFSFDSITTKTSHVSTASYELCRVTISMDKKQEKIRNMEEYLLYKPKTKIYKKNKINKKDMGMPFLTLKDGWGT